MVVAAIFSTMSKFPKRDVVLIVFRARLSLSPDNPMRRDSPDGEIVAT
jgi:hypothetical protein